MKYARTKKGLLRQSLISGSIVVVFASIMIAIFIYEKSFSEELESIKSQEIQIIRQISQEKENNKFILETYEIFKKLPKQKLPNSSSDLESPAGRIRAARPIVEHLKRKYKISDLDIVFSNPKEEENKLGKGITVSKSNININLAAANDEIFMSFLYDLVNSLPGYIKVTTLRINKKKFDKSILVHAVRSDEFISLVTGNITMEWFTVDGEIFNFNLEKNDNQS